MSNTAGGGSAAAVEGGGASAGLGVQSARGHTAGIRARRPRQPNTHHKPERRRRPRPQVANRSESPRSRLAAPGSFTKQQRRRRRGRRCIWLSDSMRLHGGAHRPEHARRKRARRCHKPARTANEIIITRKMFLTSAGTEDHLLTAPTQTLRPRRPNKHRSPDRHCSDNGGPDHQSTQAPEVTTGRERQLHQKAASEASKARVPLAQRQQGAPRWSGRSLAQRRAKGATMLAYQAAGQDIQNKQTPRPCHEPPGREP